MSDLMKLFITDVYLYLIPSGKPTGSGGSINMVLSLEMSHTHIYTSVSGPTSIMKQIYDKKVKSIKWFVFSALCAMCNI